MVMGLENQQKINIIVPPKITCLRFIPTKFFYSFWSGKLFNCNNTRTFISNYYSRVCWLCYHWNMDVWAM